MREFTKMVEPIIPTRNAVIVELVDNKFVVSIEYKDEALLPKLQQEAQAMVRHLHPQYYIDSEHLNNMG
jgi:hypothetical protein